MFLTKALKMEVRLLRKCTIKRFTVWLLLVSVFFLLFLLSNFRPWGPLTRALPASPGTTSSRSAAVNSTRRDLSWKDLVSTSGMNRTSNSRLVIYNRVDKCGSSTLQTLISRLSRKLRSFTKFSSKLYWNRYLDKLSQSLLVNLLTKKSKKFPVIYDRHISYIEFTTMKKSRPIYINLVRDPVQRFISHFYFLRSSRRKGNANYTENGWLQKNLTECVLDGDAECAMSADYRHHHPRFGAEFFQPMTAYFCGHEPMCREFNSRPALQTALQNLERNYAVVGVLELFRESLQVFESFVPRYFRNVVKVYDEEKKKTVNRNQARPGTPTAVTEALTRRLPADIELYKFATQRLYLQYDTVRSLRGVTTAKTTPS